MDKRTLLAIVLSVIIVVGGFFVQVTIANNQRGQAQATSSAAPSQASASPTAAPAAANAPAPSPAAAGAQPAATKPASGLADPKLPADAIVPVGAEPATAGPVVVDNGTFKASFDPKGANLVSLQLVEKKGGNDKDEYKYQDGKNPVEMIMPGPDAGLATRLGGKDSPLLAAGFVQTPSADANVVEFKRDFVVNNAPAKPFTLVKRYTFFPKELVFKFDVELTNSVNEQIPLNNGGSAYSLHLGPQIGPLSSRILQNQDPRRFVVYSASNRRVENYNHNADIAIKDRFSWVAADGKYFTFIIVPGSADYKLDLAMKDYGSENKQGLQLNLARAPIAASKQLDSYYIYAGPRQSSILEKYNKDGDNSAGQRELNLNQVLDSGNPLGWLEEAMKFIMGLFYFLIPNYGVAIILLTILVKVLLYPLSKKGMVGMARMQQLSPRIKELQEKYKENPQKMNAEMQELYKKEKISPLGGCLPMLLQIPFFFAMYNLFYNHFDMRGALFIPGWIPDLSVPDTLLQFNFLLPILNLHVTGLHLLPVLYVASQLLTTKLTQSASAGMSKGQANFMMYGLPLVFFFILYESPSGLFVYWIFQNVLSIFQQQYINRHLEKLNLRQKAASANPRTAAANARSAAASKRKTK